LIVGGVVIVEIKSVPRLKALHQRQLVSYLRSTELRVGLLMNFNVTLLKNGLKRIVVQRGLREHRELRGHRDRTVDRYL
jgi:GxxExxY protein